MRIMNTHRAKYKMIQIYNNTKTSCSIHYNKWIQYYYASAAKAQFYICSIGIFFINFAIFAFYSLSIYILISFILQNQNECRSKPVSFSITPDTLHNVQEVMIPPVRASFLQEDILIISIFQLSLAVFLY